MGIKNKIPLVVVATGVMNAGGTESLIMEMLRHRSARVRYIMLIHHDGKISEGVFDAEIRSLGVPMHYIESIGSQGVKNYVQRFKQKMDEIGPVDIIHSHLNASGGIISMAAKLAGIRHRICHCHADIRYPGNLVHKAKHEANLALMKILIDHYATNMWACSEAAWRRLFLPWRKRVVINNMIDTRRYMASEEKRIAAKQKLGLGNKYIVGAVGRVAPIKNYECIIRAIVDTDAHFVCFGRYDINNSYCKSLEELAIRLCVQDRVHWMGNSNSICDDIHCFDLFVMPSFTEGFGMAAIEAQAASIPSLISTGVPRVVDVNAGLVKYLDPDKADIWKEEINKHKTYNKCLSPDDKLLQAFINKGFDSPSSVKEIENEYLSMI